MKWKFLAIAISTSLFSSDEFVVNLKDPEYSLGAIKTEKGGIITAPGLRIQGEKIVYTHTKEEHKVVASGNLMLDYQGRIFVGDSLEFDIDSKTGYLINGRTQEGSWYMGGERIELCSDGSFQLYNAYVTTCVGRDNPWAIYAAFGNISDEGQLKAKDVTFRVLKFPLLWIPGYATTLDKFRDSPVRYRVTWDTGLGPKFSSRYRFYSNGNFNAFARLDLRVKVESGSGLPTGVLPGGSLEADYLSDDKRTLFQSKNYGAYDKIFKNENGPIRYRFQGIFKTKSKDEYSRFHVQWDKLSDIEMVSEFKDPDFEITTEKTTYLEGAHYDKWVFGGLTVRPKINSFQSLNEELPYSVVGIRSFEIGKTGIIMENYANGSYLDYKYATTLKEILRSTHSGRMQTINSIYRPFSYGAFNITPRAGLTAIFYSNSPKEKGIGQFLYTFGGTAHFRFSKQFETLRHTVEPYAQYLSYSKPRIRVDKYFVFDINDGYDQLEQLRFGLRHYFFSPDMSVFSPLFALDVYSYGFWGARSFDERIPKTFVDLTFNQPAWSINGGLGWNIQENLLDYGNIQFLWTASSTFAFGIEFRHRSRFWWRKANYENYVVDFARSIEDLLASPLSDKRNTLLTKTHIRLSPRWNLQLQTHHGWGRSDEPSYNGAKLDLYTMLTGSWQMKFTYEYMLNDKGRTSFSFKLIK